MNPGSTKTNKTGRHHPARVEKEEGLIEGFFFHLRNTYVGRALGSIWAPTEAVQDGGEDSD